MPLANQQGDVRAQRGDGSAQQRQTGQTRGASLTIKLTITLPHHQPRASTHRTADHLSGRGSITGAYHLMLNQNILGPAGISWMTLGTLEQPQSQISLVRARAKSNRHPKYDCYCRHKIRKPARVKPPLRGYKARPRPWSLTAGGSTLRAAAESSAL